MTTQTKTRNLFWRTERPTDNAGCPPVEQRYNKGIMILAIRLRIAMNSTKVGVDKTGSTSTRMPEKCP